MSDNRIYTDRDCVETGSGCSLKGKVVVLKESALEAGFWPAALLLYGREWSQWECLGKVCVFGELKERRI